MIQVTTYTDSDNTACSVDLDENWKEQGRIGPTTSLIIVRGEDSVRHFMTLEQLEALRDLLNEKLPKSVAFCA